MTEESSEIKLKENSLGFYSAILIQSTIFISFTVFFYYQFNNNIQTSIILTIILSLKVISILKLPPSYPDPDKKFRIRQTIYQYMFDIMALGIFIYTALSKDSIQHTYYQILAYIIGIILLFISTHFLINAIKNRNADAHGLISPKEARYYLNKIK